MFVVDRKDQKKCKLELCRTLLMNHPADTGEKKKEHIGRPVCLSMSRFAFRVISSRCETFPSSFIAASLSILWKGLGTNVLLGSEDCFKVDIWWVTKQQGLNEQWESFKGNDDWRHDW